MDVSIIIVNYNTNKHLRKCLISIFKHFKAIEYEVLVIDNNSSDRSIEKLVQKFPKVRFYLRDINDGFGAGCNYAAHHAKGKYFYFVNPDIIFINNAIYDFHKFMEEHLDVGICSGLLVDNDGEPQYSFNFFPSISWEFSQAISRSSGKRIKKLLCNPLLAENSMKEFKVDWFIGASMFIRSKQFKLINGFDKDMFLYYEDVDLALRLRKLNKRIVILPWIRIQHYGKSSVSNLNGDDIYFHNMHKSKLIYMYKYFSYFKRNIIRLLYIIGMILRILTNPFRQNKAAYTCSQAKIVLKIYLSRNDFRK